MRRPTCGDCVFFQGAALATGDRDAGHCRHDPPRSELVMAPQGPAVLTIDRATKGTHFGCQHHPRMGDFLHYETLTPKETEAPVSANANGNGARLNILV